ncbi:MAG: magnesium-translocating P-type ATPase [Burkholderiaceae bacterium]|nr:magnesium-translocating P-type ATPase [Burkholderiaceae bacterium]
MPWFQPRFARFLHSRRAAQHFRRIFLLESLDRQHPDRAVPEDLSRTLQSASEEDLDALLARLGGHRQGLTSAQAAAQLERLGPNEIGHEKPLPAWLHLWHCYQNPFNLLLTALALISWLTHDHQATTVIGSMVLLSTLMRFIEEGRSHRAAERLKSLVSNTATVLRRPSTQPPADAQAPTAAPAPSLQELPLRQLVVGEVLQLSAGDMIPADARVLSAKDLFVSQAAMTGESLPVEKQAWLPPGAAANVLEAPNLLFMGTNVVSGSATAVVLATGRATYFGTIAERVTAQDRAPTAFQTGVNGVSGLLIRFALVMVPIVFLVNGLTKGDWTEAFLFAMSVAVGLTPEMLPMVVTSTLAKGAVLLSRKKVVVKRLDAIQNFGAMDVLCTDKTGTLTQDRIVLERHIDPLGAPSDAVLAFAFLNSHYQTGLKNLLDHAVLEHVEVAAELQLEHNYRKVDEIPFDFQRRRMSVVVSEAKHHHELICKGAVEEVLAACTQVQEGGSTRALDAALLERVQAVTRALNEEGLRVVAVAVKEVPPDKTTYGVADEAGLTLIGYIAFLDPPKESAAPALKALAAHGITVKVLTGDNGLVTAKICRQVGLGSAQVVLGATLDGLDDAALAPVVRDNHLFAKLTPLHKERIVRALKAQGHVVGFMGDGINDAPALRAADIGISVDSAVDIAKEAADIILLEKSLMVLDEGVLEGRKTFSNMLKYIRMTASSNFGNVFSVLVACAFLPFLPMLPMHLLVQNLLYDFSQSAIPFDNVDEELMRQPLHWNPGDLGRFMVFFGPISSVFDLLTFALMWWVFEAHSIASQSLFQSGWFVVGLLTQTLIVHLLRTPKLPFVQSRAAALLTSMTLLVAAVGLFLPMGPLAGYFKLTPLPPSYFAWLAAILLGYAGMITGLKRYYVRRFGWQ